MIKKFKATYLFLSSLIIGLLQIPFAFAKSATGNKIFYTHDSTVSHTPTDSLRLMPAIKSVYDSLHLNIKGLSAQAYEYAKKGFDFLQQEGKLINDSIISIIDFSKPSNEKRLFVIDIKNYNVLFQTLVAHGRNTGKELANTFSNKASSFMSSPGFYITGPTYEGKNGYSLKLEGVESGINDNAFERGIVVHGAPYVSQDLVNAQGYIGRSQGCPAVPVQYAESIINTIKNGSCLFIFHPSYISHSRML
ncbi:MAG TPA: murein L,D-transpeptidase catalytic domain family protein [Chitinophagaceae bacterium]|nr:murein L,D-transpeptidase catalytic domain family protein [Chitinophagaceae bacterium]HNA19605.1 murein L,D-transpeptidase catalytic domain family protein [Chitinophagaceae bacterium]HNA95954.1 murein L,D-transpeptidase catalytic domain family protein [Chitinophagaceae bacterium]HNF38285.1 murein L,D-transpeptidase catalytic domain family protein [Chitinophagaceae bacterium]HNF47416.1 murein L,D-transpeptidase catalytic domain family protein [Chitinophagaceae bacterium]